MLVWLSGIHPTLQHLVSAVLPFSAFVQMSSEAKDRVVRRVTQSGALPVSRDAPGYAAVLKLLGVDGSGEDDETEAALNEEAARAGERPQNADSWCFRACS